MFTHFVIQNNFKKGFNHENTFHYPPGRPYNNQPKKLSMTQQSLADATGINRSLISRMEKEDFLPSIPQLEQLGEVLGFEPIDVFTDGTQEKKRNITQPMNIAVA